MDRAWQPIETAPQWERIILFDEEWADTMGAIQIGLMDDRACLTEGFEGSEGFKGFQPTHWMPLPEPPK